MAGEYRERFVEVMVDEFQDTNRLQVELVELVRGDELFLVGDEFQSIYASAGPRSRSSGACAPRPGTRSSSSPRTTGRGRT